MQPINYTAAAPQIDLTQSLAGFSQGLADLRKRQADEQAKQAAAIAAQQAQQQYAADLQSTVKDGSLQAWGVLQAKYPSIADNLGKAAANFDQGYKDREFADGLRVQAALESGRTDVVRPMIEDKIAALKNSGQNPKVYEQVLSALDAGDIKAAKNVTNFALMAADGKRFGEYATSRGTVEKLPAEVRKGEADATTAEAVARTEDEKRKADIANTWSQMTERAERLALDRDKLQSEIESRLDERAAKLVELSDTSKKIVNDATGAAISAEAATGRLLTLADGLDVEAGKGTMGAGWGSLGSANEWLRSKFGMPGGMTGLRKEYLEMRNSEAMRNRQPGNTTDRDLEFLLEPFPDQFTDAKSLAAYTRKMAKAAAVTAAYESAKAEWVEGVGFMGKPKKDIEVDGVKVSAGTTFPKFAAQYVDRKVKETMSKKTVEGRGYMRWATPQAAPATPNGLGSGSFGIGGQ